MRPAHSIRHGWVNWLAAVAILLQSVVPLVHHPAASTQSGWAPALASLCLTSGDTAPVAPNDDKAPLHKLPPCGVCQTLQLLGTGFVPSTALELPQPAAITDDYAAMVPAPCGSYQVASAQARAPPLNV